MKKTRLYIGAAAIAVALTAVSCGTMRSAGSRVQDTWNSITGSDTRKGAHETAVKVGVGELPTADLTPLQTETMINRIIFGKWNVMGVDGQHVEGDDRPYIEFDSTAVNPFIVKFYAYTGCNTVNGAIAVTQGNVMEKVGEYAATMRLCPDALYEYPMTQALESVRRYKLESAGRGDYLMYFYNEAGKNTMTLRKNDMAFVDGAWLVTDIGQIQVKEGDMPEPMQIVIDMNERRLHGNTGCNVLNGNITVNPDVQNSIGFDQLATTRMACPNAGLEQQLSAALSRVVRAEQGRRPGVLLLLDAAGNTVVKLKRTELTLNK